MKKTNFLFWNLNRTNLADYVAEIVIAYDIDIVLLAEADDATIKNTIDFLRKYCGANWISSRQQSKKVRLLHRLPANKVFHVGASISRAEFWIVKLSPKLNINLCGVHLIDKLTHDPDEQFSDSQRIASQIADREKLDRNSNTVVVGDFNMNPFERGMCSADAFHSVMDRNIARKKARIVGGLSYRFFYNPTWQHVVRINEGAFGSYHINKSKYLEYFWHALDQVLVRPELLNQFADEDVEVILQTGVAMLVNEKTMKPNVSDHLPIKFSIES